LPTSTIFSSRFCRLGGRGEPSWKVRGSSGGDLLVVVDFDGSKRLKDLEFTYIPIWIRVFDLPLGMMNSVNGMVLGNRIGRALAVDTEDDGSAVGGFLRIKVKIDIRKPLMRGILLERAEGEDDCWCPIRYEYLPNFCYGCGLLGHVEKECDSCVEEEVGFKQFGDWLRVTPTRWKGQGDQRQRWSEGGSSGSGKFGRSRESGKLSFAQDHSRKPASSLKMNSYSDPELKDDGTSPIKPSDKVGEGRLGTPKALVFEVEVEGGSLQKDGRGGQQQEGGGKTLGAVVQLEDNSATPNLEQVEVPNNAGFFVMQGDGSHMIGEKDMDVDGVAGGGTGVEGKVQNVLGLVQGMKEGGVALAVQVESKGVEVLGGGGKKPDSFQRRPRDPGTLSEAQPLVLERKRSREPESSGEELDHRKKRVVGAEAGFGNDNMVNGKAGLLGESCLTK